MLFLSFEQLKKEKRKMIMKSYIGCKVSMLYQGCNDTTPQRIRGHVVSVRNVVGDHKGTLLLIATGEQPVYRSVYLKKAQGFRVLQRPENN